MNRLGAIAIVIGGLCTAQSLQAQNEADVQRYSTNYFMGTARFNAMGGAFGALGGDMSASHLNPASLGVFRFSEITFTPSVEVAGITTRLNESAQNEVKDKIVINNFGFLLANETRNPKWKSVNFGISFNRLNSFNDYLSSTTDVPFNQTLASDFVLDAQGLSLNDLSNFGTGIAYDTFVIDYDSLNTEYYSFYESEDAIQQMHTAERDGRLTETSLVLGANYDDILYIGGSVNFQSVFYTSEIRISETQVSPGTSNLETYTMRENLQTEGLGVNAKIGAIVKAGKMFRFGASVHTPTTLALEDVFSSTISSRVRNSNGTESFSSTGEGFFEYRVRTPWRFMLSGAAVIGSKGIISAQYEYSNMNGAELLGANRSGSNLDFSNANSMIAEFYSTAQSFRFGGEFRATKNFFIRGGFAMFENPVPANESFIADLNRYQYSGGLGYRQSSWSLDLSYQMAIFDEPYRVNASGSRAILENQLTSIALTASFRL